MSDLTADDIVSALTETEERIAAGLTPVQQDLFEKFRLFLSDVLAGVPAEHMIEQARDAGRIFHDVALEHGHAAADLVVIGCAMFRAGASVH